MQGLRPSWDTFLEKELAQARPALEKDLARMSELAVSHKHRRDAHRKRVRRQRTVILEWSDGVHDVEATRVAHVSWTATFLE